MPGGPALLDDAGLIADEHRVRAAQVVKVVSHRLGHANMTVAAQTYTHRLVGKDRDAADRVAGLLFGEDWDVSKGPDEKDAEDE